MKEHPLIALLARLCGDIIKSANNEPSKIIPLQEAIAAAIINDPLLQVSTNFQFDQLDELHNQQLDSKDLRELNELLKRVEQRVQQEGINIRVYKREVPVLSSQVRGSIPVWARGARIEETMGPFTNLNGRRYWIDIYRVIPTSKISMQGSAIPFALMNVQVNNVIRVTGPSNYKITKGTAWLQGDLFNVASPDQVYAGLTISGGEISLSSPVFFANDQLVIPNGVTATITLNLEQKSVTDISPDDAGVDVKKALLAAPKTLKFSINHNGVNFLEVGDASWNLYGQDIAFKYNPALPKVWNPQLNRIVIPYTTDVAEMEVLQAGGSTCQMSGKGKIIMGAWCISGAVININSPLEADGTGAMAVLVDKELIASWYGLKDANLNEPGFTLLKNSFVMLMPGRINIMSLFASNPTGRQRYNLWQEVKTINEVETTMPFQYMDLNFSNQFFFFYDCQQKGIESVLTTANCTACVNRPVKVNGTPFAMNSTQTMLLISISKPLQLLYLLDDDILVDNYKKQLALNPNPIGAAIPPLRFRANAVALNNALLTVSPVASFYLLGDLKSEDQFDSCILIYGFGLLQYLPTLPDPYAANVGYLERRTKNTRFENTGAVLQNAVRLYTLNNIKSLLVCMMAWKNTEKPAVHFFLGDKPANTTLPQVNPNSITATTIDTNPLRDVNLSDVTSTDLLRTRTFTALEKEYDLQNKQWNNAFDNNEFSGGFVRQEMALQMRSNSISDLQNTLLFNNAFTLLDVSTNADLMGVSVGMASDGFIYRKHYAVAEDIPGQPFSINGMNVQANSRFVQLFALPQVSWEPVINTTTDITNIAKDPLPGLLLFQNDGVPAQIANTGKLPVSIDPINMSEKLVNMHKTEPNFAAWSNFTLPFGMLAMAIYHKQNPGSNATIDLIKASFPGLLNTGLQLKTVGYDHPTNENKVFDGSAHQLDNTFNLLFPEPTGRSILGGSVTEIYNDEFGSLFNLNPDKTLPVERYDFSGYGANVFSHWLNANAALAQTSQALFDIWRGRSAHEIIQVRSMIYPWAIRVVRTITMYRGSNGFEWRIDSGWKAESDGIFDFRSPIKDFPVDTPATTAAKVEERARTYTFHPGMVEGVYNVHNIKEDTTLLPFTKSWNKTTGVYLDDKGIPQDVGAGQNLDVKLVPVYFDADVQMDDVMPEVKPKKVPAQRMLGYLQLRPRGVFIDAEDFAQLLTLNDGLGGPVDCTVNINNSKQQMRISRVEVNASRDAANQRVFVAAAKGAPVLPKDGSWSVVQHNATSKEVTPLSNGQVIPLIREGERKFAVGLQTYSQDKELKPLNIAEPSELFKGLENRLQQFAFLQSTGENKVLFRNPIFKINEDTLKGSIPDLADAYRLMNSKGIFPKLEDLPKMDEIGDAANKFAMKIREEGYQLLNNTIADAEKKLEQLLPEGPFFIVKTEPVKVYIDYKPTKPDGSSTTPGAKAKLDFDIDSTANKWLNKMNDVTMVVDLGPFKRLLLIRGKFDTAKGKAPSFVGPELEFGPDLKPVVDILVLLSQIAIDPNYKDILKKGLKIAMSNSPNNWEYKFQADKEIAEIQFPPKDLQTGAPLILAASLKTGVYFNVAVPLPPTNGIPAPSAGAYVEFYGKLNVMCVSVGVGTIYAVGQVTVRISADTVTGPALYMKFGFGIEAVVSLPVIGNVSVYFAVGVELNLTTQEIVIGAFVLFRGRASILGGIVTITIQIEASGKVQSRIGGPANGQTNMIAQVTFSLDISICFIINISFSETWQEQKQIS